MRFSWLISQFTPRITPLISFSTAPMMLLPLAFTSATTGSSRLAFSQPGTSVKKSSTPCQAVWKAWHTLSTKVFRPSNFSISEPMWPIMAMALMPRKSPICPMALYRPVVSTVLPLKKVFARIWGWDDFCV